MSEAVPPALAWTPILYDVAQALESTDRPEERVERALSLMRRLVGCETCALLEAEPVLPSDISAVPACGGKAREELTARLHHLLHLVSERAPEEARKVTLARSDAGSHLAVPIFSLGEIIGILFVQRSWPPYEETHLGFVSVVAAQIGAYLTAVRAERDIRASEARFRRLYESGMIGIAFMTPSGDVLEANDAFLGLFGVSQDELEARSINWREMTPPEYRGADDIAMRRVAENGACAPYEKGFERKDGRPITALVGMADLPTEEPLYVAFVLDVSERKRAETERAGLLEQRDNDISLLQMFLAMLGHDLRSPLGAVKMSAEHLRRSGGDPVALPVRRILSSTGRMERMVDQLLDLTRIRIAGGVQVQLKRLDLADLCHRAVDELKTAHPGSAVRLDLESPLWGHWDPDRLFQVISNLVGNAIQYAEPGSEVGVTLKSGDDSAELRVHNRGTIPEERIPVLFDPFRGFGANRRAGGLGLGLFITKHMVQAHEGSIEVRSSESEGTSFTVRLPRRASRSAAASPARP